MIGEKEHKVALYADNIVLSVTETTSSLEYKPHLFLGSCTISPIIPEIRLSGIL